MNTNRYTPKPLSIISFNNKIEYKGEIFSKMIKINPFTLINIDKLLNTHLFSTSLKEICIIEDSDKKIIHDFLNIKLTEHKAYLYICSKMCSFK